MSLPGKLRHRWRLLAHLWQIERRSNPRLPAIGLISKGFLSSRAWLYPFDRFDPALFLTDVEIEARLPRLNPEKERDILGNKDRFHQWASEAGLPTARLVGILDDGRIDRSTEIGPGGVVVKPVGGSGGAGVRIVTSPDALPRSGRFVLETPVTPHDYACAIFPGSINTIRVMIGQLPAQEPVFLGAAHRFGTARSAPTDNFKAGGIAALVEPESGRLSAAVADLGGPVRATFDRHPETGAPIAGVTVPGWDDVFALALRATRALPGLCYVGWDIAVTPDGPVVIEGNAGLANPNLVQFHEPILLRPEARRFFVETGVISPGRAKRLTSPRPS